jgi:ABC-type multidrug transport system permease subunit
MKKLVRDMFIIAIMKSIPDFKRQPLMLMVLGLISAIPLFFIAIFSQGMIGQGLIGTMISMVAFIGIAAGIQDITWDRYVKIREMIVAMPVHPLSYALGIAIAPLIISLPGIVFFAIIAFLLGVLTFSSIGWLVSALTLCWASMSGLGFLISTYMRKSSPYTLSNLSTLLGIGLIFLPPVYYPEEMLGSYSWISLLFPTSNSAGLIRVYSGLSTMDWGNLALRWILLIAVTAVSIILTVAKAKWRED